MKTITGSLMGCMLVACVYSTTVAAQDSQSTEASKPAPVQENGVTYMSGGIGESEEGMMKRASGKYDLMLTFATKEHGAYISDVKVDIVDAKGNNVVSTVSDGPIFLVNLPAGKYKVTAEAEGKAVTRQINVSRKQQSKSAFLWPQRLVATPAPAPMPETNVTQSNERPASDTSSETAAPMNAAPTQ